MVAADAEAPVVAQDLVDAPAARDQHAIGSAQHTTALAHRRPQRCTVQVLLRTRVLDGELPGVTRGDIAILDEHILEPLDRALAFLGLPRGLHRELGRRALTQPVERVQRRREQVSTPPQADEGLGFLELRRTAVERDAEGPVRSVLSGLEAEVALTRIGHARPRRARLGHARFGHAEEGVALAGETARAVAATDPALHHLELLGDARVEGDEDEAAIGVVAVLGITLVGLVARQHASLRPVRHAAADDSRASPTRSLLPSGRPGARIDAADVGVEGAAAALRIVLEGEVLVDRVRLRRCRVGVFDQRTTALPAAHHLGQHQVAAQSAAAGRLAHGHAQARHVLPQLAHDHEAAVVQEVQARLLLRVVCDRREVGFVVVTEQHLAEVHLVRVRDRPRRRRELWLPVAVGEAEVLHHAARAIAQALHRLHAQHAHAGERTAAVGDEPGHELVHHVVRFARIVDPALRIGPGADLHDHVHGRHLHLDRRRIGRQVPVRARQRPAARMVGAKVAEHAGTRLHAFLELLRQPAGQLGLAHAQTPQALEGHGRVVERADAGMFAPEIELEPAVRLHDRAGDARAQHAQELGARHRIVKREQHQAGMRDLVVAGEDAALHVAGVGHARPGRWQRRHRARADQLGLPSGLQPVQLAIEAHADRADDFGQQVRVLDQRQELRQQVACGAQQHVTVRRAGQVEVGHAEQQRQRLQALAQGVDGVQRRGLPDLVGDLLRAGTAHADRGQAGDCRIRLAAVPQFLGAQVVHVADCQRVGVEEKARLHLHPVHPAAPGVEALGREHVAFGVAEDRVQQRADLLPQHADIGLPGAVEGDCQQHVVLGLEHRDPHGMDARHPLDRIGYRTLQRELVRRTAPAVEELQQPLGARLVADGFERGHQAPLQRRKQGQIAGSGEALALDDEVCAHHASWNLIAHYCYPRFGRTQCAARQGVINLVEASRHLARSTGSGAPLRDRAVLPRRFVGPRASPAL